MPLVMDAPWTVHLPKLAGWYGIKSIGRAIVQLDTHTYALRTALGQPTAWQRVGPRRSRAAVLHDKPMSRVLMDVQELAWGRETALKA